MSRAEYRKSALARLRRRPLVALGKLAALLFVPGAIPVMGALFAARLAQTQCWISALIDTLL